MRSKGTDRTRENELMRQLSQHDGASPLFRILLDKNLQRVADRMAAKGLIEKGHSIEDSRLVIFYKKADV